MSVFDHRTTIAADPGVVFDWHKRQGAFEALCPPWMTVNVLKKSGGIAPGGRVSLEIPVGPARIRWDLEHDSYIEGHQFRDVQTSGPFRDWKHIHKVLPTKTGCVLEDRIEFKLHWMLLPSFIVSEFLKHELRRMFTYRHEVLASVAPLLNKKVKTMNIAVSGSHGLIGSALGPLLTTQGHQVKRMVRRASESSSNDIVWSPGDESIDPAKLEGLDCIVHLAGENIADGRWSDEKKKAIYDSRVKRTRTLCEAIAKMKTPPAVLVCASAIGYYGDRGDQELDERSSKGTGFLSNLCLEWEEATNAAKEAGVRVVNIRIGVVLSPKGGALAKMLPPFQMGAGGPIGNGKQYMSWISVDDVAGAINHCITESTVSGAVNLVAPRPVTNGEFTNSLGKVLFRPTFFPVPDFAARLVFGEMADELLLSSTRVEPSKLQETGYQFMYPDIESALRHVLGK